MPRDPQAKVYWPQSCTRRLVILRLYEAYPTPLSTKDIIGLNHKYAVDTVLSWLSQRGIARRVAYSLYVLSNEYKRFLDGLAARLGGKDKLREYLLNQCREAESGAHSPT